MASLSTFSELLRLWPPNTLHLDIGRPYPTVQAWGRRNSIPPDYWPAVIESARKQGIDGVDEALMLKLALTKKPKATRTGKAR